MHAAIIDAFGQPPRYGTTTDPAPAAGELVIDVTAAALHPLARSIAAGTHYISGTSTPLILGTDGVGRTSDGTLVYFAGLTPPQGSMAERVALPASAVIPLPGNADPVSVAALVNPAVSAWLALHERAKLAAGETVLVLGATGNAGRMAVQLARHLGAGTVLAAGRNPDSLAELAGLGADSTICYSDLVHDAATLAGTGADVDVVVDYLWGRPAEITLGAIACARTTKRRLRWVHVGAVAGSDIMLPGEILRKADITIAGSGHGSVGPACLHAAQRSVLATLSETRLQVQAIPLKLSDIQHAWSLAIPRGSRIVLTPSDLPAAPARPLRYP